MIKVNLHKYANLFADYTELRIQENRNQLIAMVNGNIMRNSSSSESGISARVYKKGSWGFASNPTISDESAKLTIQSATDNANYIDLKENRKQDPLPQVCANSENDFSSNKKIKSPKEIIQFIKSIDNQITKKYLDLYSRTIVLNSLDMEKSLLNADESYSYSMIPRSLIYLILNMQKDGKPVELFHSFGGFGQFEDVFENPEDLFPEIDELYNHLKKKAEGVYPAAGKHDVILDSHLAGILAHEAIGHTTEADIVRGGSVAGDSLNKKVANETVTLIDYANTVHEKLCPVPVFIDDEGTKAEDAVIIEKGILKTFLHNKESANYFKVAPTGNARAYGYSDEPIIRMRNTAIAPGKSKLQDMIASIEDGYYLMKPSNGQADSPANLCLGLYRDMR